MLATHRDTPTPTCTTPQSSMVRDTGTPVGTAVGIIRARPPGVFMCAGTPGPAFVLVSATVGVRFALPSAVAVGIAAAGGGQAATADIGEGIVTATGAGETLVTERAIVRGSDNHTGKISTAPSAIRRGQRRLPPLVAIV